jgi:predicted GNAT superfamily acetyltransferase
MQIKVKALHEPTDELIDLLWQLDKAIFSEPYSREKIARTITTKHQLVCLIAYANNVPCAFKVGYELSSRVFYSWIGGVVPKYRGNGIAQKLMVVQHDIASDLSYRTVRTHTQNKFRDMLLLNIRSGFDVVGVINEPGSGKSVIVLDKTL